MRCTWARTSTGWCRAIARSIPTGELHWLVAGPEGAAIVVTMVPRTTLIREADGVEIVPPWVS